MRTHQKHGLLMAGINGHKIYFKNEKFRVVARYQFKDIESKEDYDTVSKYVTLKYQPLEQKEKIIQDFLKLVEGMI